MQRWLVLAALGLGVDAPSAQPPQQQAPLVLAKLEARKVVTVIDRTTRVERRVYETSAQALTDLTVSPRSTYLAVLEHHEAGSGLYEPRVVVLTADGNVVWRSAHEAHRYTWCCDGSSLAYVAGRDNESDLGFVPEGLFILDAASGEERLVPGLEKAYVVHWASFDTSLYVRSTGPVPVYRYQVQTGSLTPSPHLDILFSPAGDYYLHFPDDESRPRLRDARSDREVAFPDPALMGVPGWWVDRGDHTDELRLIGWALESGNVLLFTRSKAVAIGQAPPGGARLARRQPIEHFLYDVERRRIVRRLSGEIPAWSAPPGALPVLSKGRIDVIVNH